MVCIRFPYPTRIICRCFRLCGWLSSWCLVPWIDHMSFHFSVNQIYRNSSVNFIDSGEYFFFIMFNPAYWIVPKLDGCIHYYTLQAVLPLGQAVLNFNHFPISDWSSSLSISQPIAHQIDLKFGGCIHYGTPHSQFLRFAECPPSPGLWLSSFHTFLDKQLIILWP